MQRVERSTKDQSRAWPLAMEKVEQKDKLMSGINIEDGINIYKAWRSQATCK